MNYSKASLFSLAIAVSAYGVISLWGGGAGAHFLHSAQALGVVGLIMVLSLSLLNYGLRFWRWHTYVARLGHEVGALSGFEYYLSGFGLTATPGKVGEAVRGFYLKQHGVPYAQTFSMLFAERVSDLIAMVLLAGLGLWTLPQYHTFIAMVLLAVPVLLVLLRRPAAFHAIHRAVARAGWVKLAALLGKLNVLLESAQKLLSGRMLPLGLLLSVCAWAAEGLGFFLILRLLHAQVSIDVAIGVYAVSVLIGALSFMPGGLGSTEAAMVLLLVYLGVDRATALSVTLICRAATLWFAILIGLAAILDLQRRAPPAKLSTET